MKKDKIYDIVFLLATAVLAIVLLPIFLKNASPAEAAPAPAPEQQAAETVPSAETEATAETTETTTQTMQTTQTTQTEQTTQATEAQPTSPPPYRQTEYVLTAADPEYFDDALFIGDSRTLGLKEYANMGGAVIFASSDLDLRVIHDMRMTFGELEMVTLSQLISQRTFGKIYITIGLNERTMKKSAFIKEYSRLIEELRQAQPDAVIYVGTNLHVTSQYSKNNSITNSYITSINKKIKKLGNKDAGIFVLDPVEQFDDRSGSLNTTYSSDGFHLNQDGCGKLRAWLLDHTMQPSAQ